MTPLTELRANHIRGLLHDARARRGDSEFVLEGPHLLEAAIENAFKLIEYVAFTQDAVVRHTALLDHAESLGIPVYSLPAKLADRISDTQEPQGIFAVARMPRSAHLRGNAVLALDGVQDPGNVGTIIRAAAWFGIQDMLLGEGTADPFAPKVVRSTQGAIFDVGLEQSADLLKRLTDLRNAGWQIVAATLDAAAKPVFEFTFPDKAILLLGTEARGIRPELLELAGEQIVIPRYGVGESLNVALSAAIILAEFRRRNPAT
jgi:TrmH family RNA methyltransferase